MITLSESVFKNCVQRMLANIAQWRQFQFALCKKTSLSRKQDMFERRHFCWTVLGKCCLLTTFIIKNCTQCPTSGIITKASFGLATKNILLSEIVHNRRTLSNEHNYEVGDRPLKFCPPELITASLAVERRWRHSYSTSKFHNLRNGAWLR